MNTRLMMNSLLLLIILLTPTMTQAKLRLPEQTLIVEVEGNPHEHKLYIEKNHPFVKVVALYDTLFNGLALQAREQHLQKVYERSFIKATYDVNTYEVNPEYASIKTDFNQKLKTDQSNVPATINNTSFTGKGVKIGVVDTGVDYNHPSLAENFKGGYDVVDLDEDPQETLPAEGMPTIHGTHVAGIIAAKGPFKGVAPESEIYAYRALGPGGFGTSIQVIAALERAVKDGMDIINLSLGNSINGPDVPTSIAVDRAYELGVLVVTANGNDGPADWTVGSPATAINSLAVGALAPEKAVYVLQDQQTNKAIPFHSLPESPAWTLEGSYEVVHLKDHTKSLHGKIVFITALEEPLEKIIEQVERAGAIAVLIEQSTQPLMAVDLSEQLPLPIIPLTKTNSQWLQSQLTKGSYIAKIKRKQIDKGIAPFSSRGPVTGDWAIKPDLIAPGTNILSTVPGGYQALNGTSMAAPYVAGSLALMKEAKPTWSKEQIIGALKSTAKPLTNHLGDLISPIVQGAGEIQIKEAIETKAIIYDPMLSFGKVNHEQQVIQHLLTIENMTKEEQVYSFVIPKQTKGYQWHLPHTFTLQAFEKKAIPLELSIYPLNLKDPIYQGYLTLESKDQTFKLPYLFVHEDVKFPFLMGFGISVNPFSIEEYIYQFYLAIDAKEVQIDLFEEEALTFVQNLLTVTDLKVGLHKGEIPIENMPDPGHYIAQITVTHEKGKQRTFEQTIMIE